MSQPPAAAAQSDDALRISVTTLLADAWPALFGIWGPLGRDRLTLGRALHADWQAREAERDPGFRAEVPLQAELKADGRVVLLSGRADGVREAADGALCVEEVKGHAAGVEPGRSRRDAAARQLRLYAWMLARQSARPVRARLLWIPFEAHADVRAEEIPLDASEVERWLDRALARRLASLDALERERLARRAAAAAIRFPHPTRRPGQAEIEAAVEQCVVAGEQLLLEAPTGLGKTAAVVHAALAAALPRGHRVHHATSRTSQRAGVIAAYARMGIAAAAPAVRLASQRSLCLNEVLLCHEAHCHYAREHARALGRGDPLGRLLASGALSRPARLRAEAERLPACAWALALQGAERAALVVGDHNHLVGGAALPAFRPDGDPRDQVVVIDEAHQLPDRARDEASAALGSPQLQRARDALRFLGAAVHAPVADALGAIAAWLDETATELGGDAADFAAPCEPDAARLEALGSALDRAFAPWLRQKVALRDLEPEDPVQAAWQAVAALRRTLLVRDVEITPFVERRDGATRLVAWCPDPAPRLRALFSRCRAVIAVSATLSPLAWRRDLLGFDPARCAELRVPSAFPAAHRRLVIDARVGTRLRERRAEAPRIAGRLAALADAVPGHTLALLPSYRFAAEVAEALPPGIRERLVLQRADADEHERESWLEALRAAPEAAHLVLGVAGGVLAEGVDFGGGGLRAVAVVGPCLPPADAERELLRAHFDARGEPGFELAYVLPGMTRVVQAAGRLLRSERDRGVIALFGRRFLQAPFRELLPEDWLDGLEPEACCGDPAQAARDFFAAAG